MAKHKRYPTYRASGVEWLGDLPTHWEVRRIKWVADLNPSKTEERAYLAADTPVTFLPMEKVGTEGQIDSSESVGASQVWNGYTYFRRGDILVAKITPCFENGKGAHLNSLPTEVGFGSTEFHVLRAKPSINPRFLYLLTTDIAFRQCGTESMTGAAGQKRVSADFVANYQVPLPPLAEQRAIATFLDRETAKIDALVSKRERLIELLQEKRTALISHTVTRGLDPKAQLKDSGVDWLGEIPAHWEVKRLKSICRFAYGDSLPAEARTGEGNSVYGSNGVVGFHSFPNTNGECLIIGRKGSFGKVHYSTDPAFAIDTTFFVDSRTTDANIRWLYYLLESLNLDAASKDSAVPGLSRDDAYQQIGSYPPFPEQRAIASFLDRETARLDSLITKVNTAIKFLHELRTALISAAVTGKIDVREETECT